MSPSPSLSAERARQIALQATGRCTICGQRPLATQSRCATCREKHRARGRQAWRARHGKQKPIAKPTPTSHPHVAGVSKLFVTQTAKRELQANGSWWADCPDRETFNRRLQEELPRITRNELAWPTGSQSYAPEAA